MKGSPFQRNFGIGSPVKQGLKKESKFLETEQQEQERKKGERKESDMNKERYPETVNLPKEIKSKLPKTPRKDTLKGITGFEADYPIISKVIKLTNPISTTKRKIEDVQKITKDVVKKGKKAYDYFTKK